MKENIIIWQKVVFITWGGNEKKKDEGHNIHIIYTQPKKKKKPILKCWTFFYLDI